MTSDEPAITAAIQTYLDGLHEGDPDKLRAVFLESCDLTTVTEGKLSAMTRDEWCDLVAGRPTPVSQGLERHDEIVSIDQSSETSAMVKVKCAIPPRFFTDYLSLLKVGGEWQVAQKVYATRVE